jgi:hypothetical protein
MDWLSDPLLDDRLFKSVPPAARRRYYHALGRMMHNFACVEDILNTAVSTFVFNPSPYVEGPDMDWYRTLDAIKAVTGGMRIAVLRDALKRLLRVHKASKKSRDEIAFVFAQLGEIQYMRDRLAHNAAVPMPPFGSGLYSTNNLSTASEFEKFDEILFTTSMLDNMADDLAEIPFFIHQALYPERWRPVRRRGRPPQPHSWRYKPSELERRGPKYHPKRE